MQTFLPYPDFKRSVSVLDDKRLGKQRVECLKILKALETGKGWIHHPATKMWEGYEDALKDYMNECIIEWGRRGFKNNMQLNEIKVNYCLPHWFGDEDYHRSHKQNLLRKDFGYYCTIFRQDWSDDWYVWVVNGRKFKKKVNSKERVYFK